MTGELVLVHKPVLLLHFDHVPGPCKQGETCSKTIVWLKCFPQSSLESHGGEILPTEPAFCNLDSTIRDEHSRTDTSVVCVCVCVSTCLSLCQLLCKTSVDPGRSCPFLSHLAASSLSVCSGSRCYCQPPLDKWEAYWLPSAPKLLQISFKNFVLLNL